MRLLEKAPAGVEVKWYVCTTSTVRDIEGQPIDFYSYFHEGDIVWVSKNKDYHDKKIFPFNNRNFINYRRIDFRELTKEEIYRHVPATYPRIKVSPLKTLSNEVRIYKKPLINSSWHIVIEDYVARGEIYYAKGEIFWASESYAKKNISVPYPESNFHMTNFETGKSRPVTIEELDRAKILQDFGVGFVYEEQFLGLEDSLTPLYRFKTRKEFREEGRLDGMGVPSGWSSAMLPFLGETLDEKNSELIHNGSRFLSGNIKGVNLDQWSFEISDFVLDSVPRPILSEASLSNLMFEESGVDSEMSFIESVMDREGHKVHQKTQTIPVVKAKNPVSLEGATSKPIDPIMWGVDPVQTSSKNKVTPMYEVSGFKKKSKKKRFT